MKRVVDILSSYGLIDKLVNHLRRFNLVLNKATKLVRTIDSMQEAIAIWTVKINSFEFHSHPTDIS